MNRTRSLIIPPAVLALAGAAVLAAGWSTSAHGAGTRYADPIVIVGDDLVGLDGTARDDISVWLMHHGAWQRVPAQVDERTTGGLYAESEDKLLDENDELVFTLGDLGDKAPDDAWPPGISLEQARARVEAKVTDPLDDELVSYYYIFGARGDGPMPEAVVAWDPGTREVRTGEYIIGLADQNADGYFGIKRLSLYGDGADLIDRLKLRGKLSALGLEQAVTEENLGTVLTLLGIDLGFDPVIFGPVRVVLGEGGGYAYANRFALFGGFGALEDLPGGGAGLDIKDLRLSLDFSPEAAPATYADPNVPSGVPIDGQPDVVPEAPVVTWRQIDFVAGRLVVLSNPVAADSKARGYYRDDTHTADGDTGDKQSWGEHGVTAPDLASLVDTGFAREAVVLPAGRSFSSDQLAKNLATPLEIEITGQGAVPTPAVTTPPPTTPASTPTRTRTPTITPTRIGPSLLHSIVLPWLARAVPGGRQAASSPWRLSDG